MRGEVLRGGPAVVISLFVAAFVASSACQVVAGYQTFKGHPCDVLPASKVDEDGLDTLVLSKQPDGSCYWVDKTEVTVQRYTQFLAGHATPIGWDHDRCESWKTAPSDPADETDDPCTLAASAESDPFRLTKPIRCVDWCDARAFCQWAGKDLCGGITNTPGVTEPSDAPNPWASACSPEGLYLPYGNGSTFVSGVCNVGLSVDAGQCRALDHEEYCAPTDVDSFPGCTGPSGMVDMIGNVSEWVFQCGYNSDGGIDGPDPLCQHQGGSFDNSLEDVTATCWGMAAIDKRAARDRRIGLRCCASLTEAEHNLTMQ